MGVWSELYRDAMEKCPHLPICKEDFCPQGSVLSMAIVPEGRWNEFEKLFSHRKKYLRDEVFMREVFLPHVFGKMRENNVLALEPRVDLIDKLHDRDGRLLFSTDGQYRGAKHFASMIQKAAVDAGIQVNLIQSINGRQDCIREISRAAPLIRRLYDDKVIVAWDLVGHERKRLHVEHILEDPTAGSELNLHLGERSRVGDSEHERYSGSTWLQAKRFAHPMVDDQMLREHQENVRNKDAAWEFLPLCNIALGYLDSQVDAVNTFILLLRNSPQKIVVGSDDPGMLNNPDGVTMDLYILACGEPI